MRIVLITMPPNRTETMERLRFLSKRPALMIFPLIFNGFYKLSLLKLQTAVL
jgi:hypothetical protein